MKMRIIHRYLGFFLAGIMAIYALSGIVLIYRDTDVFKRIDHIQTNIGGGLSEAELGEALQMRRFRVDSTANNIMYFRDGSYNVATGDADYITKELPFFIDKMTHLHKATSSRPLAFLNITFALCLLFFVISSFWMFFPGTKVFKKGLWFSAAGLTFALILLFV